MPVRVVSPTEKIARIVRRLESRRPQRKARPSQLEAFRRWVKIADLDAGGWSEQMIADACGVSLEFVDDVLTMPASRIRDARAAIGGEP